MKLATPTATRLQTAGMSDAQLQMSEFAHALRKARTQRQLSIEQASKECPLSDKQILGLEAADFGAFYSSAYALRGAERYATFLGIGPVPQACIAAFDTRARSNDRRLTQDPDSRPDHWTSRLRHWMDPLKAARPR
ncbi:helix-turn-helix domain-containing protein [Povalibacter sp.]|uniref:helix-turn-helix domain-containing protein n=1 Tax=Povalibacter sp. TaxID=1962978 RepID=UPI002F41D326